MRKILFACIIIITIALNACGSGNSSSSSPPIPTTSPAVSPTASPIPSPTLTPTISPTPTSTPTTLPLAYAIFANQESDNYTQCEVNNSGIIANTCNNQNPASGALNNPYSVAISHNYIYFVNYNESSYTQCIIGNSGVIASSCTNIQLNGVLNNPTTLAFSGNYAYFGDQGFLDNTQNSIGTYTQCNISESGLIDKNTCMAITPSSFTSGQILDGLTFTESYAYFSDNTNDSYYTCTIDSNTGMIESTTCTNGQEASLTLSSPFSLLANSNYIYFTDNYPSGDYSQCTLTNSGAIVNGSCQQFSNIPTYGSWGIAFYESYAYIVNNSETNNSYSYTQCSVLNESIVSTSCNIIPVSKLNRPSGIAFYQTTH